MADYDRNSINIQEVRLESGEVIHGIPDDEQLEEADEIFYSIEVRGETFYRWIAGPYESIDDVYDTIEDDTDFYAEAAA